MWEPPSDPVPPGASVNAPVAGDPSGSRLATALEAGLAVFAVTAGALMTFGARRSGSFSAFTEVGSRIARDVVLPRWGDALLGVGAHLGQSLVLGAVTAFLLGGRPDASRLRAALIAVILWQVAALVPWIAAVRADLALPLGPVARIGLTALVVAALAIVPRRTQH